mmetsp:Transcript_8308/g.9434  ORF Transcript_8308/g.9434 Transcript_8308/m.9434 type:complete len:230 (+) Transcript_8308:3053-3742(+)
MSASTHCAAATLGAFALSPLRASSACRRGSRRGNAALPTLDRRPCVTATAPTRATAVLFPPLRMTASRLLRRFSFSTSTTRAIPLKVASDVASFSAASALSSGVPWTVVVVFRRPAFSTRVRSSASDPVTLTLSASHSILSSSALRSARVLAAAGAAAEALGFWLDDCFLLSRLGISWMSGTICCLVRCWLRRPSPFFCTERWPILPPLPPLRPRVPRAFPRCSPLELA